MTDHFPTPVLQRAFHEKLGYNKPCALTVLQIDRAGAIVERFDLDSVPYDGVFISGSGFFKTDAPQDFKLKHAGSIDKNAIEIYYEIIDNCDYYYFFAGEDCRQDVAVFDPDKPGGETRLLRQSVDVNAFCTICRIGSDVFLAFRPYSGRRGVQGP